MKIYIAVAHGYGDFNGAEVFRYKKDVKEFILKFKEEIARIYGCEKDEIKWEDFGKYGIETMICGDDVYIDVYTQDVYWCKCMSKKTDKKDKNDKL